MTKQVHTYIDRSYVDATDSEKEFKSENKYRKEQARKNNREMEELKKLEGKNTPDETEDSENELSNSTDSTDWKKRYGDLRSHTSKLENNFRENISSLENKIKELESIKTRKEYPKTEDEIQEWMEKYPDVAGIIQTIAGKTSDEAVKQVQERLDRLSQQEAEAKRRNGLRMLNELHPDFMELKETEQFKDWLLSQPDNFKDSIIKPRDFEESSVKAAARVIDMYKHEFGLSKKQKTKDNTQISAATKVKTSVSDDPRNETKDGKIYESQVARMTDREFEAMQSKILEAQRSGNFVYDLSGAAR